MQGPCFFGYGSLVNLATHAYVDPAPARLTGWRREWRSTTLRPVAFLSARPEPGAQIDGVVAEVPGGDWTALDRREAAYLRHDVTDLIHPGDGATRSDVAVYRIDPTLQRAPCDGAILLSYLDTVIQGFLQIHGRDGAERFFAETDGWARPVLNDRAAPRYPRARPTDPALRALVDSGLNTLPVTVKQLE